MVPEVVNDELALAGVDLLDPAHGLRPGPLQPFAKDAGIAFSLDSAEQQLHAALIRLDL